MRRYPSCSPLLLGLGLVLPLGCVSVQPPGPLVALASKPAEPAVTAPNELPPDKAAEACLAVARELEKGGHEVDAIVQYERARQLNPRLPSVSRRLAVLYDRQCDSAKALAEYKQALQLTPRDADLLNDLGYFHYQRGDWAEAEKSLRAALAINAGHQRAWVNLGLVLGHQERYEESYEAFVRVVNPAEARGNLGVLLAKQGKHDEAKKELRQALALEPELKAARTVLARLEAPQELPAPMPAAETTLTGGSEPEGTVK